MIFGKLRCWFIRKRGGKHDYRANQLGDYTARCIRCRHVKRTRKPKLAAVKKENAA